MSVPPIDKWSAERKLAALLHGIHSRRNRCRMLIKVSNGEYAGVWERRYLQDTAELLRLLPPPARAWADADMDACCASWCGNPVVHPHNSADCIRDDGLPSPQEGMPF